jgi:uncharacterized protein (TIGR04255 family)
MSSGPLGQLRNAPLAYVLGAIKFERQLTLDKYIPALRERLQAEFPRFQPVNETIIHIDATTEPVPQNTQFTRYEFASADNRYGVVLNRETLVFHATAYSNYKTFSQRLEGVLKNVGAELEHLFIRRAGLRYVDVLIPQEGETPDVYVNAGLRSMPTLSLPSQYNSGFAVSEFKMEKGSLVVRYATARGHLGLPPDLQPLLLAEPDIMQRAVPDNILTGLLDFDRFVPQEVSFDAAYVKSVFDSLHDDLSIAFLDLTTDHAKQVWNREP